MKKIAVLGATGSVGGSVLSVVRAHPGEFAVTGLAACRASDRLAALAAEFPGATIAVAEGGDGYRGRLAEAGCQGGVITGEDAADRLMADVDADMCIAAVSGTAGLECAFTAAERGMTVLLANKEVLVSAGDLFMEKASRCGARVLPLDSEHAALWQCLHGRDASTVSRVTITASGGPFWTWSAEEMAAAGPEAALRHPVWDMGAKISIDSATLANKALEVMEARSLYGFGAVDVLVHPQSVVHGMVEWRDGSVMAHMGACDMRQPIAYMLFYPDGATWTGSRVDLARVGRLEFFEVDDARFPLFGLGMRAGVQGGLVPAYFNAANEAVVGMFLKGAIRFGDMARIVGKVMESAPTEKVTEVSQVMEAHARAKALAEENAARLSGRKGAVAVR